MTPELLMEHLEGVRDQVTQLLEENARLRKELASIEFMQKWRVSTSIGFPHSHRVQVLTIHHPNGDTQTLRDEGCEQGKWFSKGKL